MSESEIAANPVAVSHQNGVTTISIQRAEVRNAVNPETARTLYAAFRAFEADTDAQVAVLTGEGGYFCAGFDLKSAGAGAADDWMQNLGISPDRQDPIGDPCPGPMGPTRLVLSKPVIAAIEGPVVAGGMELAAWCDMRVMAEGSVAGVYCRRWGVPLIDGGTIRLPQILGQGRANDLILTGRPLEAAEAYQIGFANRLCPAGDALTVAQALAADLTQFPQACMRADHLSARQDPAELAQALRREWRSAQAFAAEGRAGAQRFASGLGRSGDFGQI
ncbi:putative enoyl-CoA hydratase echA6 [Phaeobacter sp. CECT 5382]|uniref:crotonase/enoyl-CoA hydratase family protein n=1 Tax=Phaeobacter sp. CECT 5382 TaxID=1712645 RepID=UPI0006DB3F27|nr:crotonase/enoyl-CoA hydratase family protein [Phaeobacter sp. CECT 5382]CUH86108.1 putative enoyl-CoA hydratase echA6 [Phaeobacter sp. CECT 5382]